MIRVVTIMILTMLGMVRAGAAADLSLVKSAKLLPGAVVSIHIAEDRREALVQTIAVTGEINAPYVGIMKAAGLTCDELAGRIKQKLERDFFRQATVVVKIVDSSGSMDVSCVLRTDWVVAVGKVRREGKYELPDDNSLTVSGFLKKAGGPTSGAMPVIKIIRRTPSGHKTILVDSHAVLVRKSKEHDIYLREQDVMIVE